MKPRVELEFLWIILLYSQILSQRFEMSESLEPHWFSGLSLWLDLPKSSLWEIFAVSEMEKKGVAEVNPALIRSEPEIWIQTLHSPPEIWGRLKSLHTYIDETRNWRICWHEQRFHKLRAAFNTMQVFLVFKAMWKLNTQHTWKRNWFTRAFTILRHIRTPAFAGVKHDCAMLCQ